MNGLVVVGGSYAALNIASAARQAGYDGNIVMLTDEHHLPYHRPPLSKGYLLGLTDRQTLPLRGETFYRDHHIDVEFGARVTRIDTAGFVESTRGNFAFDKLALAPGTRARQLPVPGTHLDGVVSLRSLDDAEAMRARMGDVGSVVIIGGGFIGLELAASMCKAGIETTVIEGLDRVLARVTGPTMSRFVQQQFAAHGVRIVCGVAVAGIEGEAGKVRAVRTTDGRAYAADLVVIAVGAVPNIELAEPLGLTCPQGIIVDAQGRTADERIFAAGDCAFGDNVHAGRAMRLESVQNATDQAKAAGAAIAGQTTINNVVPWFWSDQFDLKLQMVGLHDGSAQEIVRGSIDARKFSIFYLRADRIIAIDSVNCTSDNILGRKLLGRSHSVSAAQIADPDFNLRSLIA